MKREVDRTHIMRHEGESNHLRRFRVFLSETSESYFSSLFEADAFAFRVFHDYGLPVSIFKGDTFLYGYGE